MEKNSKWIKILIFAVIILGLFIARNDGDISSDDLKDTASTNASIFDNTENHNSIGDTVTLGSFEFTVNGVYHNNVLENNDSTLNLDEEFDDAYKKAINSNEAFSNGTFLITEILVKNITKDGKYFYNSMVTLVNDDGSEHDASLILGSFIEENTGVDAPYINPDSSHTVYLVYTIPDNFAFDDPNIDHNFALKISGGEFSIGEEIFCFKNKDALLFEN